MVLGCLCARVCDPVCLSLCPSVLACACVRACVRVSLKVCVRLSGTCSWSTTSKSHCPGAPVPVAPRLPSPLPCPPPLLPSSARAARTALVRNTGCTPPSDRCTPPSDTPQTSYRSLNQKCLWRREEVGHGNASLGDGLEHCGFASLAHTTLSPHLHFNPRREHAGVGLG